MVDSGQPGPGRAAAAPAAIEPVPFVNPRCPGLGVEVMPLAQLRQRLPARHRSARSRPDFHQLMLVESGSAVHAVDFERHHVPAGAVLTVHAGQVQQFVEDADAQGWIVLFRPEFLPAEALPDTALVPLEGAPVRLPEARREGIGLSVRALAAAYEDCDGRPAAVRALQHLLLALLLQLARVRDDVDREPGPPGLRRVLQRFRQALEQRFAGEREAAAYARLVGCSTRTLSRACMALAGCTPRELIERRVTLEAKRLLAHSPLTVSAIALELGFSEATNFVKFFKRGAGCTPAAFRAGTREGATGDAN